MLALTINILNQYTVNCITVRPERITTLIFLSLSWHNTDYKKQ